VTRGLIEPSLHVRDAIVDFLRIRLLRRIPRGGLYGFKFRAYVPGHEIAHVAFFSGRLVKQRGVLGLVGCPGDCRQRGVLRNAGGLFQGC
jgi:hypothetical protein